MTVKVIGLIIGILISCFGIYYLVDGESKNHSCPLSYSFCIFFGSLSGNMAFIASSLPSFIAVS